MFFPADLTAHDIHEALNKKSIDGVQNRLMI